MTTQTHDTARPAINADQAELDKFGALASRWWDPESEFKPLHAINPLRLEWIQECAGSLAGKKVLDVGCGRRHPVRGDGRAAEPRSPGSTWPTNP
jgi:2-polyprenyl-6-hydroxyphenyl methylase/3-demethylubiquinone-9 3-methyltransferase